jgi:ABC-2 type transport system ATP-binding protein
MIEISEVSVAFGDRQVLHAVSATVPDGSITGLVGPNGAGKSTLLKFATGLSRRGSGEVRYDEVRLGDAAHPARLLGSMISSAWLPGRMSGVALLRYVARLQAVPRTQVAPTLAAVGLDDAGRQPIRTYSLGMRQRLGLAVALLAEPRCIVLDEPVNGLDIDGVRWLRDLLRAEARRGTSILISSHLMSELEQIADAVVVIVDGRVVRAGSMDALQKGRADEVIVDGPDRVALAAAVERAGGRPAPHRRGVLVIGLPPTEVARVATTDGGGLWHLERTTRSLEDVYEEAVDGR